MKSHGSSSALAVRRPILRESTKLKNARLYPVVAVPARNEEQRLPVLLATLNAQKRTDQAPLDVVLVLNNCEDETREVVRKALPTLSNLAVHTIEVVFPAAMAHVGSARRLAMDSALALVPHLRQGVILTTDADAVPEPGWVEANLRALRRGADLVGGELFGNRAEEARLGPGFAARASAAKEYSVLCDRLACLIDPQRHDPWPRHSDHTGGSLAIRAELYRSLGGLPPLPRREDLALVSHARASGAKLVHPLDVKVEVSARLAGRAEGGMADCLKEWMRAEADGIPHLVEDPARVEARLLRRRAIRDLGHLDPQRIRTAALRLGLRAASLRDERLQPKPASRLVEEFAPDEPDAPATVPVGPAIARLREMIASREDADRAA